MKGILTFYFLLFRCSNRLDILLYMFALYRCCTAEFGVFLLQYGVDLPEPIHTPKKKTLRPNELTRRYLVADKFVFLFASIAQ